MKIFLSGHQGMVGSTILASLKTKGYTDIITRTRAELDLLDQAVVRDFVLAEKPELVIVAAAKVGGIHANNTFPAEFIYENLMVECNLIHSAYLAGCQKLLFLGSSCIYPRLANQPMLEIELLTGALEPTNEPYAIAKIAGIKLCESYNRQYGTDYRSIMPANLYGPGDNFHPENSHVIPALIRRFHEAKLEDADSVLVWGSGNAKREFLHVSDMSRACVHLIELDRANYECHTEPMVSHVNVGVGEDVTIRQLAETVKQVVGFKGSIEFDSSKSDGPPRKLVSIDKLEGMGWSPQISLEQGLTDTYAWFLQNQDSFRS
jgi:GDP-L-fucose synthase